MPACARWLVRGSAGALIAIGLLRAAPAAAAGDRLFELRVYHTVPGQLATMVARFRDTTAGLLAKHHLKVVGYWTGTDAGGTDSTFVFLLSHADRDQAKRNWAAMVADPRFQEIEKAERSDKTLARADVLYLQPTDFSRSR